MSSTVPGQSGVSLTPDQVTALSGLMHETAAFGIDIAADTFRSIRAVTFTPASGKDDEDTTPIVRFWTISVAGTIRESSPESVAA